jgi:hypothetical protein
MRSPFRPTVRAFLQSLSLQSSCAAREQVRYYQLAENEWDPKRGRAVAKIVYNFGRADELDPEALRRLAASILRVVNENTGAATAGAGAEVRLRDAWPYGGVYVLEALA